MPDNLPDDLAALKQIPAQMQSKVVHLEEENALLRQRLFGRKSEQTIDPATPQLALFNEAESLAELVAEDVDEKEVARSKRRGKRKPLPADLPRSEIIHELPEHELACVCGCRKFTIGEEVSKQLEMVPMQIRVIKHIRKVYACCNCERPRSPVIYPRKGSKKRGESQCADNVTDHQICGRLPLHRFEKVLGRNGVDIPRQTLARWIIKYCDLNIQLDQRSQFVDAFSEVDQLGVQIHFSTLASGRIMASWLLRESGTASGISSER